MDNRTKKIIVAGAGATITIIAGALIAIGIVIREIVRGEDS